MIVRFRVDPGYLMGQNLGIDPEPSAERFAEQLRAALARELPEATSRVELGSPHGSAIEGAHGAHDSVRLRVEGLARAIRGAGHWIVYR